MNLTLNNKARKTPKSFKGYKGVELIDKIIDIDQSPIGRTPRSNPATYTKVMDPIRDLFGKMNEARRRGFTKRRFSFNAREGRCGACEGQGYHLIEMHFLSDVWVTCDQCKGRRYNRETLAVTFRGQTIADVLDMEITKAVELFESQPKILRILQTLEEVGLGYMKLGQPGNTLSGGEAQRIRLASQIGAGLVGVTYILDEPSIGLHQRDNSKLLSTLKRLKDLGNTVIVVEHDKETIENADHIIDIGPGAGEHGGKVCFSGNYKKLLSNKSSLTGQYLAGTKKISVERSSSNGLDKSIGISQCSGNNLKNVDLKIPLGKMVCITGVSGSGKSVSYTHLTLPTSDLV